jgi:hypothetical protein
MEKPKRVDKYFKVFPNRIIHYIHYYPHSYSVKTYGWSLYNFKQPTLDIYFGKHTIVFILNREWQ